jgi:hypothetical protein
MTPLKKRIESCLKTVIEAQLTADSLTCTVVKGHNQADKGSLPYLMVVCEATPDDPEMPASAYSYRPVIKVFACSDVNEDTETDIDDFITSANCAMRDLSAIQTETQANYTDLHVHLVRPVTEITDFDGENIQYDGVEYEMIMEEIDSP